MLSSSDWVRVPAVVMGGSTISIMIILAMYGNAITEYEAASNGVVPMDGSLGTTEQAPMLPSTTSLPDEFYIIVGDFKLLKSECRKFVMVLAKRLMKTLNKCIKELKDLYPTKEEASKHFSCSIKCFMRKMNWFPENGPEMITKETFDKFMTEHIPVRFHEIGSVIAQKCLDTYLPQIDPNEEYCTAYGELVKCLQGEVDSRCGAPQS